ncbi:dUTP diphosphatase [Thiomicrorhabdus sp.]|uniref:dUTP diphosphatase n=1 Tax=Thiomicrorhabdus sp. TaxID=2039724 RepID=UPI0029C7E9FF|nr:dUTP diphosphatase [Thiomicrorhabdus sp.]
MQSQNSSEFIREMLQMQSALNVATNGAEWRSGLTQLGKTIDWRRCIYMETAELIDSYPWKHWKSVDAAVDEENVRVELVDIWHFILSLALEKFEIDQAAELLIAALDAASQKDAVDRDSQLMQKIAMHEAMMTVALQTDPVDEDYLVKLLGCFFDSCAVAALDFAQLYQLYMAKNVLNKFRQDHGYKEGTYIKIWDGKEDNVVMFEIIREMSNFSGDKLYQHLKLAYTQLD